MRISGMAFAALALIAQLVPLHSAVAKEVPIGTISHDGKSQRAIISVGGRDGQFRAIRFEVRQADVEILGLTVAYGNGAREDLKVRQTFKAGSSSRVIDLSGARRAIKQIVVSYKARRPARIAFFGVEGQAGGTAAWEKLACKEVSFGVDKDTVNVGRKEGAFRSIRLKVRKAPIEIYTLRVTFGNGVRQDLNVRSVIGNGGETRQLDLTGNIRGLDRVELLYRSIPTFKGKAEVCVEGLQR